MSHALRPTEFIWNGAVGVARHERVAIEFTAWPSALMPGRSITYLLFIPCTKQYELIECGSRRELCRDDKAAVFSWLKGLARAGHQYFDGAP